MKKFSESSIRVEMQEWNAEWKLQKKSVNAGKVF